MRTYRGIRVDLTRTVVSVGDSTGTEMLRPPPFSVPLQLAPFDWGTRGPGARRLAVALLYNASGFRCVAEAYADDFVEEFVRGWERRHWVCSAEQLLNWLLKRVLSDVDFHDIIPLPENRL